MPAPKKPKKRSPLKYFFAVMVLITILALVAERRSLLVKELYSSTPAGVLNVSTCGNYLAVVHQDKIINLWNWKDLPAAPQENGVAPFLPAVVLDAERVVSGRSDGVNSLMVSRLVDQQEIREIPLGFDNELIDIITNRDRSVLAVLLRKDSINEPSRTIYQLIMIDPDKGRADPIITIDKGGGDFQLHYGIISDDGRRAALLGGQDKKGLIMLVDLEAQQIKWEIIIPGPQQLDKADFGPDGSWFFAGGEDLVLYKIQTDDGEILDKIIVDDGVVATVNFKTFFFLEVSPDGRMVAARTNTHKGGVWDCESGRQYLDEIAHNKIASSVAFSPDSRLLAIAGMQAGGTIRIIRLDR